MALCEAARDRTAVKRGARKARSLNLQPKNTNLDFAFWGLRDDRSSAAGSPHIDAPSPRDMRFCGTTPKFITGPTTPRIDLRRTEGFTRSLSARWRASDRARRFGVEPAEPAASLGTEAGTVLPAVRQSALPAAERRSGAFHGSSVSAASQRAKPWLWLARAYVFPR